MKPVTLVRTVVARNSAVQLAGAFAFSIAPSTITPDAIPTRLMMTCSVVNAAMDMPMIMVGILLTLMDSKLGSRGHVHRSAPWHLRPTLDLRAMSCSLRCLAPWWIVRGCPQARRHD